MLLTANHLCAEKKRENSKNYFLIMLWRKNHFFEPPNHSQSRNKL